MKKTIEQGRISVRVTAALLALLMLASTALTACGSNGTGDEGASASDGTSADGTAADGTAGGTEDGETAGETEGETTAESGDSPGTVNPPDAPDHLIGDGSSTAEVYPTFSIKGGLYTDTKLKVEITAPKGYTVRYTTDGSVPTKRSTAYKSAIAITQRAGNAKVIRAACFDSAGKLKGQVITHTYVTVSSIESKTYTVMLSTDEKNLDAMYADVNAKVERAAHAEIIAPDGTRIISQDVGLRLFGGSSRHLAQKSFKIIARKDGYFGTEPYVGLGTFTYPFFPERTVLAGKNEGKVLEKYDGLILRNGGNDSLLSTAADPTYPTLLRDGVANEFIARYAPNVGASLSHFAVVYLNGEYYGILELRENQNEDYVKRLWGVLDDDVVVVKSELDTSRQCNRDDCQGHGCRFCGVWFYYETDDTAAAQSEMKAWIALAKKAAGAVDADEATYKKVYAEVAAKVDLENVKEYLAMSTFLCNTDWPYNNVRLWRYTGAAVDGVSITDGKWRFATRDMDMGMNRYSGNHQLPDIDSRPEVDMFAWVLSNYVDGYEDTWADDIGHYADALYLQGLFAFLLRDDTFRADFATYCRTIASDEACAVLMDLYEEGFSQVSPLIANHIKRWNGYVAEGFSPTQWRKATGRIKTFIQDRPAIFLRQLDQLLAKYK